MARISFVSTAVDTGVPFTETAMEKAIAAAPGGVSFCLLPQLDAATPAKSWSPVEGGRRIVRDRVNPGRAFVAPTAAASPALIANAAGSRAALRATAVSQHRMIANSSGLKLNLASGWLLIVAAYRGVAGTSYILGSPKTTGADLVPNLVVSTSGPTEYHRLMKGDVTVRLSETAPSDLGSTFHSFLWTWDTTTGFHLWVDGLPRTLSAADTAGFTDGEFGLFNRATVYGDIDLACLAHGPLSLSGEAYSGYRGNLLSTVGAECGLGVGG